MIVILDSYICDHIQLYVPLPPTGNTLSTPDKRCCYLLGKTSRQLFETDCQNRLKYKAPVPLYKRV